MGNDRRAREVFLIGSVRGCAGSELAYGSIRPLLQKTTKKTKILIGLDTEGPRYLRFLLLVCFPISLRSSRDHLRRRLSLEHSGFWILIFARVPALL